LLIAHALFMFPLHALSIFFHFTLLFDHRQTFFRKFSLSFLDLLVVLFDDAFEFFSLALFLFLSKRERSTGERKREVERFEVGKGGFKKSILNIGRHRYLAAAYPSTTTPARPLVTSTVDLEEECGPYGPAGTEVSPRWARQKRAAAGFACTFWRGGIGI